MKNNNKPSSEPLTIEDLERFMKFEMARRDCELKELMKKEWIGGVYR